MLSTGCAHSVLYFPQARRPSRVSGCAAPTGRVSATISPPREDAAAGGRKRFAYAPKTIQRAIEESPWRGCLEPIGDISTYFAKDVVGAVPDDLQGTFYINGPGRIRIQDKRYGHWFDGDGQVTSFRIDGKTNEVSVTSKLVRTSRYLKQEAAGEEEGIAVRTAWTQASSWAKNIAVIPANPANTSVVVWGGRLYALCEGGSPVELHPDTLETIGPHRFDMTLPLGFSAHGKIEERDGKRRLYNVGFGAIGPGLYDAFALSEEGKLLMKQSLPVSWTDLVFIHDSAISENYLVIILPPYKSSGLPLLKGFMGLTSLVGSFSWREEPTRVLILNKSDMSVAADTTIPTMSMYHLVSAFEDGAKLHVYSTRLVGTRDDLEANFSDMYGANFTREQGHSVHEYVFDMANGGTLLSDRPAMPPGRGAEPGEFFGINPLYQCKQPRYMYGLANLDISGYLDALQKWDLQTETCQIRYNKGRNPSEATFVPRAGATSEDDGYLLYSEYDTHRHGSDLIILDAKNIQAEPLCTVRLPHHVPFIFHGFWEPADERAQH